MRKKFWPDECGIDLLGCRGNAQCNWRPTGADGQKFAPGDTDMNSMVFLGDGLVSKSSWHALVYHDMMLLIVLVNFKAVLNIIGNPELAI